MSEFPYIHEIVEHLSVERKKRLDNTEEEAEQALVTDIIVGGKKEEGD